MLARVNSARRIVSTILTVELCLAVFTPPTHEESQREFSLVEAYASNNKKSPLFVHQLDHSPADRHHSSLFFESSLDHDQEPDANAASLYENQASRNHEDHFDESEYSGFKSYPYDEQADRNNHNHHNHRDYAGATALEGTTLSRDNSINNDNNNNDNSNNNALPNGSDGLHLQLAETENTAPDRILLTKKFIENTCHQNRGFQRDEQLNNTYLTYCSRYKLENLLSNDILDSIMHDDSRACEKILDEFIQLDETINQFDSLFIKLLSRYNCHNGYSVKWNCDDCKKAYKDWVCATHLPFYMNGERIKPCISFCERVEQRCPYLHPITREQYGGQPVFICRDPNIPFVPEITPDIPYSEPGRCYDLCHLSENLTELITDSLSKYDYNKCPDRGSIAGEARSESTGLANGSKLPGISSQDALDYTEVNSPDEEEEQDNDLAIANRTGQGKVLLSPIEKRKVVHVHNKKLEELREVLANYKNQAKTHRYHADHSSIEHSKSQNEQSHSS